MVFRDPPWSPGEQQERELQRGGGCTGLLVFEVFLPDRGADVTPGWASSQGVLQECYPSRQLSDGLSSLLIRLVCLLFMCQCCCGTKHSTWTYPKSLYGEKTREWDLICIDTVFNEYGADIPCQRPRLVWVDWQLYVCSFWHCFPRTPAHVKENVGQNVTCQKLENMW